MIKNVEIDIAAMDSSELQGQIHGHAFMVDYHLNHLPTTKDGQVDISRLTEDTGNELISPISRFQRLVNTQVRLDQIRAELANRGNNQVKSEGNN